MKNNWTWIVLAVLALAGCDYLPFGYTPVRDIVAAPANFEGKEVKLRGTVRDVTKLPMLNVKTYTLLDDAAEITVATEGNLPAVNDRIALKGTVKSVMILGGQSLGLRVEETKRLP
ncbi:MAG: hypothetical protein Q8K18_13580 [Burkholderiales bacterium]|nr:hypothetical protein [Burkholderiales bacterium]